MSKEKTKKEKTLRVRLTEQERSKISAYGQKKGLSASQVIRAYIQRLPNGSITTSE